jgi:hypothetical protein
MIVTALKNLYFGHGHRALQGEDFEVEPKDGDRLIKRGLARLPVFETTVVTERAAVWEVPEPDISDPPALATVRASVLAAMEQKRTKTELAGLPIDRSPAYFREKDNL